MKTLLKAWYFSLINQGYLYLASYILHRLNQPNNGCYSFYISDSNNEAYESGFTSFLQNDDNAGTIGPGWPGKSDNRKIKWFNNKYGFTAYVPIK